MKANIEILVSPFFIIGWFTDLLTLLFCKLKKAINFKISIIRIMDLNIKNNKNSGLTPQLNTHKFL